MRKKTAADCSGIFYRGIEKIISGGKWTEFLNSAAYTYKYDFSEQIMIYAQRPDAAACASMEVWNKKCGRWIKRGSEGIALINENGGISYVFDVSDTMSADNAPFNLWNISRSDYDALSRGAPLEDIIIKSVNEYAEDYSVSQSEDFIKFIEASAAYITLKRSLNKTDGIDTGIFDMVRKMSEDELITLGNIISDISETVLRSIEKTVMNMRRNERREQYERNYRQLHQGGNGVHQERGILHSETESAGTGQQRNRQIRNNAQSVSESVQVSGIRPSADERRAYGISGGNKRENRNVERGSEGKNSVTDGAAGQRKKSGGIYRDFARNSGTGGGNRRNGDSVRQLTFFPTEEQQKEMIEFQETVPPELPQEDIDEKIRGSFDDENAVVRFLKTTPDKSIKIFMLRKWVKPTEDISPCYAGVRIYENNIEAANLSWRAFYERTVKIFEKELYSDHVPPDVVPARENYRMIEKLSGEMLKNGITAVNLSSDGFNPLTMELSGNKITITESYIRNGELIRDPEITAEVRYTRPNISATGLIQSKRKALHIFYMIFCIRRRSAAMNLCVTAGR